jgi:hypothetical protein
VGQQEKVLQALLLEIDEKVESAELVRIDGHSLNRKELILTGNSTEVL